jgi:hypothetical protein
LKTAIAQWLFLLLANGPSGEFQSKEKQTECRGTEQNFPIGHFAGEAWKVGWKE